VGPGTTGPRRPPRIEVTEVTERNLQTLGIVITVLLHVGLGTALAIMDKDDDDKRSLLSSLDDDAVVIEASLAFKSEEQKSRQPQKKKAAPKIAPPENKVTMDANAAPSTEPDKPIPPDKIDINSIIEKNDDIDLSEDGEETGTEVPQLGSQDGSEWGTDTEAKGDPYVGELHGRIKKVWKLPTLETETGEALGCVRLDVEGKIAERTLWKKSGIANLDRSVNEALRNASDMEEPVPPHLMFLLTKKGICFRFKLEG
jgi:hypothetical protein